MHHARTRRHVADVGEQTRRNPAVRHLGAPVANLHDVDIVQVLTAAAGSRASNLGRLAASLPAGQASNSGEQLASTQVGE